MLNRQSLLKWACAALMIFAGFLAGCANEESSERPRSGEGRLKVLFLGDDAGREPAVRLRDIARPMLDRGIELFYTSDLEDIHLGNLRRSAAVLFFADHHMIADLVH